MLLDFMENNTLKQNQKGLFVLTILLEDKGYCHQIQSNSVCTSE